MLCCVVWCRSMGFCQTSLGSVASLKAAIWLALHFLFRKDISLFNIRTYSCQRDMEKRLNSGAEKDILNTKRQPTVRLQTKCSLHEEAGRHTTTEALLLGEGTSSPPHSPCPENPDTQPYSTCTDTEQGTPIPVELGVGHQGWILRMIRLHIPSMAAFRAQVTDQVTQHIQRRSNGGKGRCAKREPTQAGREAGCSVRTEG